MTISAQAFCARVYCAIVEEAELDPVQGTVALRGYLHDHDHRRPIDIQLAGATRMSWKGPPTGPDAFFELSTVEIRPIEAPSCWRLTFEPWDSAKLWFECSELRLNGELVVGPGGWVQTGLDGPSPL